MKRVALVSLALLCTAASAEAQVVEACTTDTIKLAPEMRVPATTIKEGAIGTLDGTAVVDWKPVSNRVLKIDEQTLTAWQAWRSATSSAVLLWRDGSGKACRQDFAEDGTGGRSGPPQGEPASGSGLGGVMRDATGDCDADARAWHADLVKADPDRNLTVIVFNGANPCYRTDTRRPAVHGDPIYVGVLTSNRADWANAAITFTPCDVEPAAPSVQTSGEFSTSLRQAKREEWKLLTALPRSCWNDAVTIGIKGVAVQAGYVLPQYPRYRATVHLGTLFTERHEVSYGLRPDGTDKRIFNKGPVERGPEYVASVVFYSVLRYIPSAFGGRVYKGREIRNEHNLVDRLGFSVGVGLKNPLKRFAFGFTFEAIAGVNVFAGWDRAELNVLAGDLAEDHVFKGEEKDIPVTRQWGTKGIVGLTFDLAYAAKLFK